MDAAGKDGAIGALSMAVGFIMPILVFRYFDPDK